MSKEEVRYDKVKGRGMYAACDIEKDDCLFELPFYEMITQEMIQNAPINKKVLKSGIVDEGVLKNEKEALMAIYVLHEKKS